MSLCGGLGNHSKIPWSAFGARVAIKGRIFAHPIQAGSNRFKLLPPTAIGQKAAMTNPHQSFRQYMPQKTLDESLAREG